MIFGTKNELEKLAQREIELTDRKGAATARLASAEHSAGEAVVTGDGEKEIATVERLKAEVRAIDTGISTLRSRRPEAIINVNREAAKKLRSEVAEKQAALNMLTAKTGKLLAALSDLQGVTYELSIIDLQAATPLGISNGCLQTKSDSLRVDILRLEEKALNLETAAVATYGFIDLEGVTSDTAVIAATLQHPSDGPSAESIQAWLTEAANSNRLPSRNFGDMPRRARIEWNGGVIDRSASVVFAPDVVKRASVADDARFDIASGEFRAAA